MHGTEVTAGGRRVGFRPGAWLWFVLSIAAVHLPNPATPVAAQETLEDVAGPSTTPTSAPVRVPKRSLLKFLNDGGFIGWVIVLLSVVAVGFGVEHAMTIRRSVLMPETVVDELDDLIRDGKVDEAIQACQVPENHSLVSNVVLAALQRYKNSQFGFAEYKAAVEEAGEDQTARLYRKTEVLNLIGAIAPMLGLLGTVQGMIEAFNVIAASGGMAKPDQLAGGISLALITTFEGLVVAIPVMCAFTYFRGRIDSLVSEAGNRVEQVLAPLARRA